MRDQLIIRLTENAPENVSWVRLTESNPNPIIESGSLEEAASVALGAQVIVLVPAADVLLSVANVPTQNKQRMLKALPYSMEEELAADVELLHFAIGKSKAGGQINVAVVDCDKMDYWQAIFKDIGITIDHLVTEISVIPQKENHWSIIVDGKNTYIQSNSFQGFVVDTDNLSIILPLLLREQVEQLPESIQLWCDGVNVSVKSILRDVLEPEAYNKIQLDTDFIGHHLDDGLMTLVAKQRPEIAASISLLQGNYSRREQLGKLWRPWRYAASLAGLLFVLQLGLAVTESAQLEAQYQNLKAEAGVIFKDTFPKLKRAGNEKARMQQKLIALKSTGSTKKVGFLSLLADSGQIFKQTTGLVLRSLKYKKGVLDVEIEVPSLQILDQLKQKLSQKKEWEVVIQSAASRNNVVQGRLQIKGATS